MTTQDIIIDQLLEYATEHATRGRWDIILSMDPRQLTTLVGNADTFDKAWRKARTYIRTVTGTPGSSKPAGPDRPAKAFKLTTAQFRARLAPQPVSLGEKLKCWELVVEAFGIHGHRTGKGEFEQVINAKFKQAGYLLEKVEKLAPEGVTPTLAVVVGARLSGDWLIYTRSHVLAARDGVIYDRDHRSSVKKLVTSVYKVTKISSIRPPECTCGGADPLVFGHYGACQSLRKAGR
jgi:hypothetical protein